METVDYSKFIYIAIAYVAIVIVVFLIYTAVQKRRAVKINKSNTINKRGKNKLYAFYKIFRTLPGVKKTFKKVIDNTESIYPADMVSVNKEATKIMMKSVGFAGIIILVSLLMSQGDLWYMLMGILAALVIFHYNISSTFDKMEMVLLDQLKDFLSCVRHHYLNTPIIEDAVEDTLDEIPYEIGLHISKIHEILISPIMEEKTEEYTSTSPNRFLLLLLSICTSAKEYSNGDSTFLDSLSYLKEEINAEILKKKNIKHSFATLTGISIAPVFFLKPVEAWAISNMNELKPFYNGIYGKSIMIAVFILAFAAYYMVDVLKESKRGEIIKSNIWLKIASMPKISTIFNKIINKNYTKMLKVNEDMKEVGDQTGPKALLAKQCVFAIAAFILVNSTAFISTVTEKLTMLDNYVADFDSEIIPNERYLNAMQTSTKEYVLKYKKQDITKMSRDALIADMKQGSTIQNEAYLSLMADEVIRELNEYKNTYYKWYVLLISIGASVLAFMIPKWYLRFKCSVSSMNKEEEVNQFQTLILVLMNATGIRLDEILEWMDKFAYSFKASIEDCIISLESGEQQALETMQLQEENKSFQRFVDCLKGIDESDIQTAFSEVLIDREHSLKERDMVNKQTIEKRSSTARILAFVPFMFLLIVYLLGPMVIMALKMLLVMDFSI